MAGAMGGFVAGSIVSKLVLDKTGWNKSVKEVTEKDKRSLGSSVDAIGQKMAGMGARMAAAGAVVVGAFGAMIKKTANAGDEVAKLSKKLGISTELLSGYRLAAELGGSSLAGFATGMRRLAANAVDANNGLLESQRAFDSLGISVLDSEGKMRGLEDLLLEVADRFSTMEDGTVKAALAQDLFGRSGLEMIPMLNEGREGMKAHREEAERLGMVFSSQAAKSCEDFNDRLRELKGGIAGAGKELAIQLMPMVTDFIVKVKEIIIKVREWVAANPELARKIGSVALKVGGLLAVLGPLFMLIPKLIGGIRTMAAVLSSSVGIWMAAAAAVGYYVIKLKEKAAAEEYAELATKRDAERTEEFRKKLEGIALAAGLTKEEFQKLTDKYNGNINAMALAIKRGEESKALQESMNKVGGERVAQIEEEKKKQEALRKETEIFIPVLEDVAAKQKTWGEYMQEYGVLTIKEKSAKISELLGHEEKLGRMLRDGVIDLTEYGDGVRAINDELKELGSTTVTQVLPPARNFSSLLDQAVPRMYSLVYAAGDFEDQLKAVGDRMGVSANTVLRELYNIRAAFLQTMGIMVPQWQDFAGAGETAAKDTYDAFDNLWSDVARGFGDTFKNILSGATSFKDSLGQLWGNIKDAFFSMCGQMATKWAKGLLTDLLSSTTSAVSELGGSLVSGAKNAVSAISNVLTGGIGTAVGSALGALIGNLFGSKGALGKTEGNWIHEIRDKAYDINNFMLGTVKPWFATTDKALGGYFGKFDGLKGSVDLTRQTIGSKVDMANKWLGKISEKLGNLKSAARGATITGTELVAVHGTPSTPEYIIPAPDLRSMMMPTGPVVTGSKKNRDAAIQVTVNMNGTMVTDREFVRGRLLREIEAALKSGIRRSEMQAALGV